MGTWLCYLHVDGSTYWLLYEQVDETEVEVVHLPCFGEDGSSSEVHRFPRAGTLNARSTLLLAQFALDPQGQVGNLDTLFHWRMWQGQLCSRDIIDVRRCGLEVSI